MSSQRQIDANRANGAKSHGPSSPEGRAISSQNGIRHSLFAKAVLLQGESTERFELLLATMRDELQPRNEIESGLVDTLALAKWRQMRVWALETAALNKEIRKQETACDEHDALNEDASTRAAIAFRVLGDQSRYLDLMTRYETRYDRQYNRTLDRLLRLRKNSDSATRTQFDR